MNPLNTSYISMESRTKFQGCIEDTITCVSRESCIGCNYNISDELFDNLMRERRIKYYNNEEGVMI